MSDEKKKYLVTPTLAESVDLVISAAHAVRAHVKATDDVVKETQDELALQKTSHEALRARATRMSETINAKNAVIDDMEDQIRAGRFWKIVAFAQLAIFVAIIISIKVAMP